MTTGEGILGIPDQDKAPATLPLTDPALAGIMLQQQLTDMRTDISSLATQMAVLAKKSDEGTLGGPWHWGELPPDRQASLLERVAGFVEFLNETYLSGNATLRLKPCWFRHPDVLWQVTAIYSAFVSVYNRGQVRASLAHADFHLRVLWPTLERISASQTMKACKANEHVVQDPPARLESEDLKTYLDELRKGGTNAWRNDDDSRDIVSDRVRGAAGATKKS